MYLGSAGSGKEGLVDIAFPEGAAINSVIQYQRATGGYYVKDNGQGLGTFLKIDSALELNLGHILAFGESSLAVTAIEADRLELRFLEGPRADQTM